MASAASGDLPPNQTIYVSNLYERLKKDELKQALYAAFTQFGKILDVVVMKTYRLRGQAWVVFEDVPAATNALRLMQGFPFYDKPMRIAYAKGKSDVVAKADGTFVPRDRAEVQAINDRKRAELMRRAEERRAGGAAGALVPSAPGSLGGRAGASLDDNTPPHNILFVQNLPAATSKDMLAMLFEQFPGYKEVRMVESRPGIAFVEFTNDMEASVALNGLQSFNITPENALKIVYANK